MPACVQLSNTLCRVGVHVLVAVGGHRFDGLERRVGGVDFEAVDANVLVGDGDVGARPRKGSRRLAPSASNWRYAEAASALFVTRLLTGRLVMTSAPFTKMWTGLKVWVAGLCQVL